MKRREFITLLGGAAAWPITARAQVRKAYRIGTLTSSSFESSSHAMKAFEEGMAELGYENIIYEHRFGGGRLERLTDLAKELAALNVDVIVAGNNASISAAKQVTSTVPIVMTYSIDPIGTGFIDSFAHPSGNITGLTTEITAETWGKRLELATRFIPTITHVAVVWNPDVPGMRSGLVATENAARTLGVTIQSIEVRGIEDLNAALSAFALQPPGALLVFADPLTYSHRREIVAAAARNRIPDFYSFREATVDGGLMSYGVNLPALYRRAARFVDKILKGAKPSDLPVEQPVNFDLCDAARGRRRGDRIGALFYCGA
jgi:ABC-type uncharacterized transport system substrate-binding protein